MRRKQRCRYWRFRMRKEDYGVYIMGALPMEGVSLAQLAEQMDEEIVKLQTELISEREYEKTTKPNRSPICESA